MCRHVERLEFAKYAKSPWGGKKQKRRGKFGAGLRYESQVGEELARRGFIFCHGPWIQFEDSNGKGFAQPDFVIEKSESLWVILESKLSATKAAFEQLFSLYVPLIQFLHPDVEIVGAQVCKNLRPGNWDVFEDIREVKNGGTWHWLPY